MYRVNILAVAILSACSAQTQHASPVPPKLVPPGFEAKDCHLVVDDSERSGAGIGSIQGGMDAGAQHRATQRAECHRKDAAAPGIEQCIDDNGVVRPIELCKH